MVLCGQFSAHKMFCTVQVTELTTVPEYIFLRCTGDIWQGSSKHAAHTTTSLDTQLSTECWRVTVFVVLDFNITYLSYVIFECMLCSFWAKAEMSSSGMMPSAFTQTVGRLVEVNRNRKFIVRQNWAATNNYFFQLMNLSVICFSIC